MAITPFNLSLSNQHSKLRFITFLIALGICDVANSVYMICWPSLLVRVFNTIYCWKPVPGCKPVMHRCNTYFVLRLVINLINGYFPYSTLPKLAVKLNVFFFCQETPYPYKYFFYIIWSKIFASIGMAVLRYPVEHFSAWFMTSISTNCCVICSWVRALKWGWNAPKFLEHTPFGSIVVDKRLNSSLIETITQIPVF